MASVVRRILLGGACIAAVVGAADAQTTSGYATPGASSLITTPPTAAPQTLSDTDSANLQSALAAAKRGDVSGARMAMGSLQDPIAKKIAQWQMVDSNAEAMSFFELDAARRDLAGWPRSGRRDSAAEKSLSTSGLDPARIIAWFGGAPPSTAEGAMALASAWQATGRAKDATNLIRNTFRDKVFEADAQRSMVARFGGMLTPDDYNRRADILLYGQQGPAARDMVAMLSETGQAAARVRMAYRQNAGNANDLYNSLTPDLQAQPGVVFERAAYLRRKGMDTLALPMVVNFPVPPTEEASGAIWRERKQLIVGALKAGNSAGAYAAANNTQAIAPADIAESEFYAGWIALTRLRDPDAAAAHFAQIAAVGASPITRGRALYWQGRAAEAQGDPIAAQAFYSEGARHTTTFYGQLAAEKAGMKELRLPRDPVITQADRARFYGREQVRAARILADIGQRDLFRSLVLYIDDTLPNAEESALLVDLARGYGDQDLAMRAVRTAAQRGMILTERGYPLLDHHFTPGPGAAETAFVYSISRQESNFDPAARSGVGARGMMQLMPATASLVARKLGESHSVERLGDAPYNMRLGSVYLGDMVRTFSGSYIMAAAAYNAGPGRPAQWAGLCGDPRGAATDPLDFIECIPFSETRNYVMRTLETTMVYRARLAGGVTPLTLSSDLKRGGYVYTPSVASADGISAQP
ncbi:lytic transglycosylase domain-containing protein [Caulobacter sp. RHG1]|uniref:lytic transglycosylase domain-containing protein n=1 Tax=Caulobacter sp. (strain RHG1) TaxID=2545762 RepID=UPI001553BF43|nr:lytic transglycosylase domain-containing protein [Caulobacter sp. RHG1]NQE64937.1 Soluble lytic murein transglycosylase precursor [Caulobacter sp. RHG1]